MMPGLTGRTAPATSTIVTMLGSSGTGLPRISVRTMIAAPQPSLPHVVTAMPLPNLRERFGTARCALSIRDAPDSRSPSSRPSSFTVDRFPYGKPQHHAAQPLPRGSKQRSLIIGPRTRIDDPESDGGIAVSAWFAPFSCRVGVATSLSRLPPAGGDGKHSRSSRKGGSR